MSLWKRLWAALPRLGIAGLVIVLIAGIVAAAYFAAVFPDWTGFGPPLLDAQGKELPYKTLWDWLDLLLVPLVLAIGGFFLTRSENRYALQIQERREAETRKIEEQRIVEARKIEEQRTEDVALQAYLDQMTQLLLHEALRTSQPDDEVRSVARARTLTVLRVLDGPGKATVLQFLYEAKLIGGIKKLEGSEFETIDAVVSLNGAHLDGAHLDRAYLPGANLHRAHLDGANLDGAHLLGANLHRAHLDGANLDGTRLYKANLYEANLNGANLNGANLNGANLNGAYLEGVNFDGARLDGASFDEARLDGADFTNCKVTPEQLTGRLARRRDTAL